MLLTSMKYLEQKCSVIFFPEGTRSPDGRVARFNDGAFHLAIKAQVSILPIAVEGSYGCLPKKSWKFGKPSDVHVRVLPEVHTVGLTKDNATALNAKVRQMIIAQVAECRRVPASEIDAVGP